MLRPWEKEGEQHQVGQQEVEVEVELQAVGVEQQAVEEADVNRKAMKK